MLETSTHIRLQLRAPQRRSQFTGDFVTGSPSPSKAGVALPTQHPATLSWAGFALVISRPISARWTAWLSMVFSTLSAALPQRTRTPTADMLAQNDAISFVRDYTGQVSNRKAESQKTHSS